MTGKPMPLLPRAARTAGGAVVPSLADFRILIVDDDAIVVQSISRVLAGYRHQRFALGGREALTLARSWGPDLVLLDADMPDLNGFEVFTAMRADAALADVPVIFVSQHIEPEVELAIFDAGGADFVPKPVNGPALRMRVALQLRLRQLERSVGQLQGLDALTGLAHRQRFDEHLAAEWSRAQRGGQPLALLLADLDSFGQINARLGSVAGDDALRSAAALLASMTQRPGDIAARDSGDAFALLLPGTDASGAALLARRLGQALSALDLAPPGSGDTAHTTVSLGVAVLAPRSAGSTEVAAAGGQRGADVLRLAAEFAIAAARAAGPGQARQVTVQSDDPRPDGFVATGLD